MYFWKKSKLDSKNRVILPKELRQILNLNGKKQILWISAKKKDEYDNEFILEVAVKK
jgi:DNA-binding transcriptional regulator/RsmH inhibitor MraZ